MPHTLDVGIIEFSGFASEATRIVPVTLSSGIVPESAAGAVYLVPVFVAAGELQFARIWTLLQWMGMVVRWCTC